MHAFRRPFTLVACILALTLPDLSQAQNKKVPGEKWKQSMSMEMSGMKIPTQNFEVCVPIGKADEALSRPPNNNENCALTNQQRSGNKFSADLHCTGKMAMDGHIESVMEGNRTTTKMQMTSQGMSMVMNMDATKLGTACEANDIEDLKAKAAAAAGTTPQGADLCNQFSDRFTKDPRDVQGAVALYADKSGPCATHSTKKNYCSAVQTQAGFMSLSNQERVMGKSGDGSVATRPLTTSLQSCGLGSADALRTKLLASAEKKDDWDFLVAEGNDATFQMLTTTAKRECAGRSFTNAPANRYSKLCSRYGVSLVRGDRAAAMSAAGVVGEGPGGSASVQPGKAPAAADAGSAEPAEADAQEAQKSKTREALDKSKKKLKSLFGGGGD